MLKAVSAVIIAGGRARRFGGREKGLLPLAGVPLVCHVLGRMEGRVAATAINIRRDARMAYEAALGPGRTWLFDARSVACGPLGGVLAGLEWVTRRSLAGLEGGDWLLTVPVDTPFLPADLSERLWQAAQDGDPPPLTVVAEAAGRRHHLCALWHRDAAGPLRRLVTRQKLSRVGAALAELGTRAVVFADADAFFNINTPQDLMRAEELIEVRKATR